MKRLIAVIVILVMVVGFSALHVYHTLKLTNEIKALCGQVMKGYSEENWNEVREDISKIQEIWDRSHMWAYITLDTKQIDEIEISLKQATAYGDIEASEDFIGEFTMFCMLMEHLPKQETFSVGELL